MAKLLNGILGGISGKVGGVVGGKWKETNYIRAYAIPSNPQSAAQTAQRNKFAAIVKFAKKLLASVIQPFWDPFISTMSGYNDFVRTNLSLWSDDIGWDEAQISKGTLEGETITDATYITGTGLLVFNWTPSGLGDGEDTDTAHLVAYDSANNVMFMDSGNTRVDGACNMYIGAGRDFADIKTYLFFSRGSGETLIVSDSNFRQADGS